MADKCCHCKRRPAEKCGELEFVWNEMRFKVFRCGSECSKCVEKFAVERFNRLLTGIVTPVPGDLPKVDWEKYLQIDKGDREYHGGPFDQATFMLTEIGILRFAESVQECWVVIGCGMNISPLIPLSGGTGFAREIDAVEYAKAKYSKALYSVRVVYQESSAAIVNR